MVRRLASVLVACAGIAGFPFRILRWEVEQYLKIAKSGSVLNDMPSAEGL